MVEPVGELRFSSAKTALQNLKQPSISANYLTKKSIKNKLNSKTNFKKPFGSRIFLHKNKNGLEVVFPAQKISNLKDDFIYLGIKILASVIILPFLFLTILMFLSTMFYGLEYSMSAFSLSIASILLMICFGIFGISIALIANLIDDLIKTSIKLFQRERLQIDKKKLCLSFDWLCFKSWFIRSISLTKINKLEKILIADDNSKWGIVANIGRNQYNLASKTDLTEVEIDWLCSELSEYLNLPL